MRQSDRPDERLNSTGLTGVNPAQRATRTAVGVVAERSISTALSPATHSINRDTRNHPKSSCLRSGRQVQPNDHRWVVYACIARYRLVHQTIASRLGDFRLVSTDAGRTK